MDTESYWRTRTTSEARDAGYDFVRLTCGSCGNITDYPIGLLLQRRGVTEQTFIGMLRFKCRKCGRSEPVIGVHGQSQSPGHFARPPRA